MKLWQLAAATCGAALCALGAAASTVTYYYVGAPYVVSNFPASERPLFTLGYLELDTSKLPPGQDLRNWSVTGGVEGDFFSPDGEYRRSPEVVAMDFWNSNSGAGAYGDRSHYSLPGFDISFGASKQIERWSVWEDDLVLETNAFNYSADYYAHDRRGRDGRSLADWVNWDDDPIEPRQAYLEQLGYKPGTEAFDKYYDDHDLWFTSFVSGGEGSWFTTLIDFTDQITRTTQMALASPPRSYLDIAPVPLPPAVLLLIGGVGALVAVGRRRARVSPE